jgi:hypothetical protein
MTEARFTPERSPVFHAEVLPTAMRALHRGEAMGFTKGKYPLSDEGINTFVDELWSERIGQREIATLKRVLAEHERDLESLRAAFQGIYEALAENPVPRREWKAVRQYFNDDQLAHLLGISETSVQRYARAQRNTPEAVVAKLHWLALVVGYLSGSYNEYGVRRWFQRPRQALAGHSPQETLLAERDWTPDGLAARKVESLAKASMGMNIT